MLERKATDARDDPVYYQANFAGRSALLLGLGVWGFRRYGQKLKSLAEGAQNLTRQSAKAVDRKITASASQSARRAIPALPISRSATPPLDAVNIPSLKSTSDLDELVRRQKLMLIGDEVSRKEG